MKREDTERNNVLSLGERLSKTMFVAKMEESEKGIHS